MIANINVLTSFRRALKYDLSKLGASIVHTNMVSAGVGIITTEILAPAVNALVSEFSIFDHLRPNLLRAVFHTSLCPPPGETITAAMWVPIIDRYLELMDMSGCQMIATLHPVHDPDKDQGKDPDAHIPHVHISANRRRPDGTVASDSHDYSRSRRALRIIEREFGLTILVYSRGKSAPTINEIRKTRRQSKEAGLSLNPPRVWIQTRIDDALDQSPANLESFCSILEEDGVHVRFNAQTTGRVAGISFESDGIVFAGSTLGRKYSWQSLQKRGFLYEPTRDSPAVRRRSGTPKRIDQAPPGDRGREHKHGGNGIAAIVENGDNRGWIEAVRKAREEVVRRDNPGSSGDTSNEQGSHLDRGPAVSANALSANRGRDGKAPDDVPKLDNGGCRISSSSHAACQPLPSPINREIASSNRKFNLDTPDRARMGKAAGRKPEAQSLFRSVKDTAGETSERSADVHYERASSSDKAEWLKKADELVQRLTATASPDTMFELTWERPGKKKKSRSKLTAKRLREMIQFIAALLRNAARISIEVMMPGGAPSGDTGTPSNIDFTPRPRKPKPSSMEIE
jgi:hypothetical protein